MKKLVLLLVLTFLAGCVENAKNTSVDGPKWQTLLEQGSISFRGLSVVDQATIWASGTNGSVARSADGGQTWKIFQIPDAETIDFRDIYAFDDKTAIVFGIESPVKFFKTTDAGKSWKLVYLNETPGLFFSAAHFDKSGKGIAISDPFEGKFYMVTSNDNGDSWNRYRINSSPDALEGEGIFAASGTNIAMPSKDTVLFVTGCADHARVLRTTDNGKTWESITTPLDSGSESKGVFSIDFKDQNYCIIVGGDYKILGLVGENAAYSQDAGKSWKRVRSKFPTGFRECVKFVPNSDIVITTGPTGSDISYDNGKHYKRFADQGFHTLDVVPNTNAVFAAGQNGKIARLKWETLDQ